MILVVDASVAIKWFLHFRENEAYSQNALDILVAIKSGNVDLLQPPHFVSEVAAVLAREKQQEMLTTRTRIHEKTR